MLGRFRQLGNVEIVVERPSTALCRLVFTKVRIEAVKDVPH
jgi:hypothetical protein